MNSGPKIKSSFIERMGARDIPALISTVIPGPDTVPPTQSPSLKFIALNDDALEQASYFASVAIWAFQYDAWEKSFFGGASQDAAAAAAIATDQMQQIAYQLKMIRSANMDGVAIEGTPLKIEFKTVKEIKDLNAAGQLPPYPIADTSSDDDPYLILTIPPGAKGDKGDQGNQGIQGTQGIQGPIGPAGPAGSDAVCSNCTGPDGGGTGPGGGGGGGSGPGGTPNSDGQDTTVYVQDCNTPIINQPFCSNSFTYSNYDIRSLIVAAATATGHFNSATEKLISAVIDWNGAGYAGVVVLNVSNPVVSLTTSNNFPPLQISDAEDEQLVIPHSVEDFGVSGVLVVRGYGYHGSTALMLQPETVPIALNGTVSQYPILGGANCHNPPDATDPAWLKACLLSFVKHPKPVDCSASAAVAGSIQVPFTKVWSDQNDPELQYFDLANDQQWTLPPFYPTFAWRRKLKGTRNTRFHVYGFKPGKTYRAWCGTGDATRGNYFWQILGENWEDLGLASIGVQSPGTNSGGITRVDCGTITLPANWNQCSLVHVALSWSGSDFSNDMVIEELP